MDLASLCKVSGPWGQGGGVAICAGSGNNWTCGASYFGTVLGAPRGERMTMSRFTYGTSAALALCGTATAVYGIVAGECKPFAAGLVLILGASVFAVLYLGTGRKQAAPRHVSSGPGE
jgi:hypothetical protein